MSAKRVTHLHLRLPQLPSHPKPAAPRPPAVISEETNQHYLHGVAQKLAALAFEKRETLGGMDLLQATPVPQANMQALLVLKTNWEAEAANMRSPYFNYEAPEVKTAMGKFLNVLSQHVSLSQAVYEGLLQEALARSLRLAENYPAEMAARFESITTPAIPTARLKEFAKYNPLFGKWLNPMVTELTATQRQEVLRGDFTRMVQHSINEQGRPTREWYWEQLKEYLPEEVSRQEEAVTQPQAEEEDAESMSFFDSLEEVEPETQSIPEVSKKPEAEAASSESKQAEPLAPWPTARPTEPNPIAEATEAFEELPAKDHEAKRNMNPPVAPVAAALKPNEVNPAAKAATQAGNAPQPAQASKPSSTSKLEFKPLAGAPEGSLGEKLARATADQGNLNAKLGGEKITRLQDAISVAQRYQFVEELFAGDNGAYAMMIHELNSSTGWPEAQEVLIAKGQKYGWQDHQAAATQLESLIKRKF